MNAKDELIRHIKELTVIYIQLDYEKDYDTTERIEGTLEQVLPRLDFNYDEWYGQQHIRGTVWYADGTWSERGAYDGSEWWAHRKCPPLPEGAIETYNL